MHGLRGQREGRLKSMPNLFYVCNAIMKTSRVSFGINAQRKWSKISAAHLGEKLQNGIPKFRPQCFGLWLHPGKFTFPLTPQVKSLGDTAKIPWPSAWLRARAWMKVKHGWKSTEQTQIQEIQCRQFFKTDVQRTTSIQKTEQKSTCGTYTIEEHCGTSDKIGWKKKACGRNLKCG